jgi:O-antigen/teichoic acid export membrane protein
MSIAAEIRPVLDAKTAATRGLGWSGLAQLVGMLVRLGSNLILTRMLAPSVYGLFGTAMAVVTTLEWLSDLGVTPALLRLPNGSSPRYALTGWWMNMGRGLMLSALAASLAFPLAVAYGQPAIAPVLLALALRPILMSLRSPGMPELRRRMDYKSLFADEVSQTIVATAVSLTLAAISPTLWSIVAGTIAGALMGVLISYRLAPIRPRSLWDREAAKEIGHLGHQVFVNTLVMALWLNLDRLLGLKLVDEASMGFYAVAWNLTAMVEGLSTRACDVYYSHLARSHDQENQESDHAIVTHRVAIYGMPIMALGVAISPLVVAVLYSTAYAGARPLVVILGARLMVRILGQVQFQSLLAQARVGLATWSYLVALIVQAIGIFPLAKAYGVSGIAFSVLLSTTAVTVTQSLLIARNGCRTMMSLTATLFWSTVALAIGLWLS